MRTLFIVPILLAALVLPAPFANADGAVVWRAFKGKILVSDKPFDMASASEADAVKTVRAQSQSVVNTDETRTVHVVIFLTQSTGSEVLQVVFNDITDPKHKYPAMTMGAKGEDKTVELKDIAVGTERGLLKGHKYAIKAGIYKGDKLRVLAKGALSLK